MPRAILLGTGLVLALCLALNTAYALALSAADVRAIVDASGEMNAIAPIAEIAVDRLYGPRVAAPMSMAIGVTLLASVSAYILTGPRVAYAMARASSPRSPAGSPRGAPPRSRRPCRSPGRWHSSGLPRSSAS
jgi:APA family basic amino acid/polyamine antiporter